MTESIPPTNPVPVTSPPESSIPTDSNNEKIKTTEDTTVGTTQSVEQEKPISERDKKTIEAFMQSPPSGAAESCASQAPSTESFSTEETTSGGTTDTLSTNETSSDSDSSSEQDEDPTEGMSSTLTRIYNSDYVQSNEALKEDIEKSPATYESNIDKSKQMHASTEQSKDEAQENSDEVYESYQVNQDPTQSSKYEE